MVCPGAQLPGITAVHALIVEAAKDIPIIAIVDEPSRQRPIELLRAGADNLCYLEDPEQVLITVTRELRQLTTRRQLHSYEIRLKESETRCQALLNSARDAIAYIHEGAHIYANPAYLKLFGYANEEDLQGITLMNMVHNEDRDALKSFLRRSIKEGRALDPIGLTGLHNNGSQFPLQMGCIPMRLNDEPCLQILIQPTPAPQAHDQQAIELSHHDVFTGLYNRRYFTQYLDHIRTGTASGAVLYILLTDYRAISERLGLEATDQLMLDLANLLRQLVSQEEVIARFADAVFTLYTPKSSPEPVLALGEQVRKAIQAHASHAAGKLITTTAAIGICLLRADQDSASQILFQADRACELARQKGSNQVQVYSPPSDKTDEAQHEEELVVLIRNAISRQRLGLLYQPIASLQGSTEARYKVYLHILDDNNNPLPLSTLGPVAERRNLMAGLDKWVIMRALEALVECRRVGGNIPVLFIRLSRNSVKEDGFCSWLNKRLNTTGLPGNALVFEVIEDCAEQHFNEVQRLREELQRLECGFALSHFGGKPNSERLLRHLNPGYIKLDSSLIDKLAKAKDDTSRQAMTALTELAQAMNILMVATAIASAPQMASIWQFGIPLAQGEMVQAPSPTMDFDFQQFAG
jgi:diguanylate cyclase (GGDEF)-like protein/PAS domain S-box-containing protein